MDMKWLLCLLILVIILPAYAQTNSQIVDTSKGTLKLNIATEPVSPKFGETTKLKVDFINPISKKIQFHIDYSITVSGDDQNVFGPIPLVHTSSGSVTFPIIFPKDGEYKGIVEVEGILFQEIPKETATFMINVGQGIVQSNDTQADIKKSTTNDSNGGCLIATAVSGTEMSSQIQHLREIRTNIINTHSGNAFLQQFNQIYYTFSPTMADLERGNELFQELVRIIITPLVSSLLLLDYADTNSEYHTFGIGIGIILLNTSMYVVMPIVLFRQIVKYNTKKIGSVHKVLGKLNRKS